MHSFVDQTRSLNEVPELVRAIAYLSLVLVLPGAATTSSSSRHQCDEPRSALSDDEYVPAPSEMAKLAKQLFGSELSKWTRTIPWDDAWWTEDEDLVVTEQTTWKTALVSGALGPVTFSLRFDFPANSCLQAQPYGAGASFGGYGADVISTAEGGMALRQAGTATLVATVDKVSKTWPLNFEQVLLLWGEDEGDDFLARLMLLGVDEEELLTLRLPTSRPKRSIIGLDEILRNRRVGGFDALLVDALERAKSRKTQNALVALLNRVGFRRLEGAQWKRLKRLVGEGKLSRSRLRELDWLAPDEELQSQRPTSSGPVTFIHPARDPPTVFVDGTPRSNWRKRGDKVALDVDGVGLKPVRVEWKRDATAFVVPFGASATIEVYYRNHSGPRVRESTPGPRCGLIRRSKVNHGCLDIDDRPALKPNEAFDLRDRCAVANVIGVAGGSVIRFKEPILATRPGLYVLTADGHLRFDPSYGRKTPPSSCAELR